jgi:uncharacterized protein (DUF1330 family)
MEDDMPKGYWVALVDVTDADGYRAYVAANAFAFAKYGARFLMRGAPEQVPEGRMRTRLVVLEFPSLKAAQECYASPEYTAAKALRQESSMADVAIIEGYGGPQPGDA